MLQIESRWSPWEAYQPNGAMLESNDDERFARWCGHRRRDLAAVWGIKTVRLAVHGFVRRLGPRSLTRAWNLEEVRVSVDVSQGAHGEFGGGRVLCCARGSIPCVTVPSGEISEGIEDLLASFAAVVVGRGLWL
eukprot:scaffold252025_cov28-Tisochrysis_lutea.AAC.5